VEAVLDIQKSILVVDDDPSIREAVCEFLGQHGYAVHGANGGAEMDRALALRSTDLVVLDVMMPGEDGLSICRRLSQDGIPIIMLSALGDDTDRIIGLELGADDYLAKPCNPRELLARVRAVLRRRSAREDSDITSFMFNGWRLSGTERALFNPAGAAVHLTSGEFALLKAFVKNPQRILSREQLLDLVRGPAAESYDRLIDLQVSRLRRKLASGDGDDMIQTVRGEGYMFTAKVRRA
jgi:two-component system OmpR family response regulator